MKILHVTFGFPPDPAGGTELYVEALCHELEELGIETVVVAPGDRDEAYSHEGLRVRRFGWRAGTIGLPDLYSGDPVAAEAFSRILDAERPDVVHQHALTSACSTRLTSLAKARGVPVVFTYHSPTTSCQRGTLLEWGTNPCDGRLDVSRCGACALNGKGLSRALSWLLARVPERAGDVLGRAGLHGPIWTALRTRSLLRRRIDAVHDLFHLTDRFIALTPWVESVLALNGVGRERIVQLPHGVIGPAPPLSDRRRHAGSHRIRIAHLGRFDPVKGTRLLVEAMLRVPDGAIDLDIYGIVQSEGDERRRVQLRDLANRDPRITFSPAIPHQQIVERLVDYDAVAVPSQWLETGPLVVLEAFAAGVPVIGSALPGLREKIRDGVDGLLVHPFDSVDAWTAVLARCTNEPGLLVRLAGGVHPPRSMTVVANSMRELYAETLGPQWQDKTVAALGAR